VRKKTVGHLPLESPRFWSAIGLKRMKSDNNRGAQEAFRNMIDTQDYSEHDLAIATSSIAYLYTLQGKPKEAKEYFIRAAIADIKFIMTSFCIRRINSLLRILVISLFDRQGV
jgi:hypothetical protein